MAAVNGSGAGLPDGDATAGTGPGVQAPDGCSVALYRRLPYLGDLQDIERELTAFPAALELGCGTGRLCLRLQQLGVQPTGVDESAEMLAQLPPGVAGIHSATVEPGRLGDAGGFALFAEHVARSGKTVSMRLRYQAEDATWRPSFTTCSLTQAEIESLLASCGFAGFRWLGARALWLQAAAGAVVGEVADRAR